MDLSELVARERVRDTIATYAHSGDRMRLDDLAGCFAEDGVLEVKGRSRATGRQEIVEMLSPGTVDDGSNAPVARFVRNFVTNLRFDSVDPARIETSAYFVVFTQDGADHWGRYRDVLAEVGERWLFSRRLVSVDAARPGGWFAGR